MRRDYVLNNALSLVEGDRAKDYGPAHKNFQDIADLWTVLRNRGNGPGADRFTATDVAMFMIATKLARLMKSPERADHWIDIAGYAALGGEIANARAAGTTPEMDALLSVLEEKLVQKAEG